MFKALWKVGPAIILSLVFFAGDAPLIAAEETAEGFLQSSYVQPYPPSKFSYNVQNDKIVFYGTTKEEFSVNDRVVQAAEYEDTYTNIWFKNKDKIPCPTGGKFGLKTIRMKLDTLRQLKDKTEDQKEEIKRLEALLLVVLKCQKRKVNVYDGYRYVMRRPVHYYVVDPAKNEKRDITKARLACADMGYIHEIAQTQIDESGLLTDEGATLLARSQSMMVMDYYTHWKRNMNHWWHFEEFPILPPDIGYVEEQKKFMLEYLKKDWSITRGFAAKKKDVDILHKFVENYDWEAQPSMGMDQLVKYINDKIKQENDNFKTWQTSEFKTIKKDQDCFTEKGNKHTDSYVFQKVKLVDGKTYEMKFHNTTEYLGRDKINVEWAEKGKSREMTALRFKRNVSFENTPGLVVNKWQDDIWYDPAMSLLLKRKFELDIDFVQTVPRQVRDPQTGQVKVEPFQIKRNLKRTIELAIFNRESAGSSAERSEELTTFASVVNSFNSAVGTEYKDVLTRAEQFETNFIKPGQKSDFGDAVGIIKQQCANMVAIFEPTKGPKKVDTLFPNSYFCTFVPPDFNPEYEYGLIVYLGKHEENIEERVKEWGSMLLGKRFIVLGYSPQDGTYSYEATGTASGLNVVVRSLATAYKIDPQKRFMVGVGEGASMAFHMASTAFSDFDRFNTYIYVRDAPVPYANQTLGVLQDRGTANAATGSIASCGHLLIGPKNYSDPSLTLQPGQRPGPEIVRQFQALFQSINRILTTIGQNIAQNNPTWDKFFLGETKHEGSELYNKDVASFILNSVLPEIVKDKKAYFEALSKSAEKKADAPKPGPAPKKDPKKK